MQSENRILEDLARLAGGAISSFSTLKDEAEARLHEKLEKILERPWALLGAHFANVRGAIGAQGGPLDHFGAKMHPKR